MGPLAALRRPVPSNRVEPSPCPFQAFLGRTLRGMIVPNPLRPMEAIPLCPITGFPLSAAFSPSASGGLSACGVPLLGLRLNVGAIEHFGLWVSPCGLAFFEPMLAGDADFYLDLHAASHSGQYDAVCAFHVIEHVTDPLGFGRDLVQCTRPGGRIYIAVPV